jgi:hypothetical protein
MKERVSVIKKVVCGGSNPSRMPKMADAMRL